MVQPRGRAARGAWRVALLVVLLGGCGGGEAARRQTEMTQLRAQVAALGQGQEAAAKERERLAADVKALDAQSAFLVNEAKAAGEELGRLRGALAEQEGALRALRAAVDEALRKLAAPPPAPARPPAPAPARDPAPERLFTSAMTAFRAEEHGQAVLEFTELVEKYPKHALASAAQYWIGEAYYRQRDFAQALLEFQKVVDGYPQSSPVPEALLKIGLAHRALRDPARAREAWERVTRDHPASEAAAQARALLAGLGQAGRRAR